MSYKFKVVKPDGGYYSWFKNSYIATTWNEDETFISMYERNHKCKFNDDMTIEFNTQDDAVMFMLKWT